MFRLLLILTCSQALKLKLPPADEQKIRVTSAKKNHFEVKPVPKMDGGLGFADPVQKLMNQAMEYADGASEPMDILSNAGLHHPVPAADRIRMLSMNTWYGGGMVRDGTGMIANAIDFANPHLVVLQEIPILRHLQLALASKGKMYHIQSGVGDVALLSKWPIEKVEAVPGSDDGIAAFHVKWPWGKLVVGAAHLDWEHFSPAMVRGYDPSTMLVTRYDKLEKPIHQEKSAVEQILKADDNSKRGPQVQAWINYAKTLPKDAAQILAGDFNEPSHMDWTDKTKDTFDHHGLTIPWRRSQLLQWAGFQDSYREKFPDPVTHPGITWPAHAFGEKNTGWTPGADERERVDFVYHNNHLKTADAGLMGGNNYWVGGELFQPKPWHKDNYPMDLLPWFSDHKGLFVEFNVVTEKKRDPRLNY
jgi:endonuclease/exonuclease/phosphatase family metal-dependent hydrolase